jgi:hypothetical protein
MKGSSRAWDGWQTFFFCHFLKKNRQIFKPAHVPLRRSQGPLQTGAWPTKQTRAPPPGKGERAESKEALDLAREKEPNRKKHLTKQVHID